MQIINNDEFKIKLKELINKTNEYFYVVSPYLSLWEEVIFELHNLVNKNIEVIVYTRDDKNNTDHLFQISILEKIGIKVITIEQNHSKIYLNENNAIFGSMNFTDGKSEEIGVITYTDDEYKKIYNFFNDRIVTKKKKIDDRIEILKYEVLNRIYCKNNFNLFLSDDNKIIVEHEYYNLSIFMYENETILKSLGYKLYEHDCYINFELKYKKYIKDINSVIPNINAKAWYLNYDHKSEKGILKMRYHKRPFNYKNIISLIEINFVELKERVNYLIEAIETFIND